MKKVFITSLIAILLFSCSNVSVKKSDYNPKTIIADSSIQTSCPYLTKNDNGNIVLSFIKATDDTNSVMCYAVSTDGGKSFGKINEIPHSKGVHPHGENMPKIAFAKGDFAIAMWPISNSAPLHKYATLTYYVQSFDDGKSWNAQKLLVKDTDSYTQRFFDMAALPDGNIATIWLDNRNRKSSNYLSLYYAATQGTKGFQKGRLLDSTACTCCRTDMLIDKQKIIHIAYRKILHDSIRDIVHLFSTDKGKTFSLPQRISPDNFVIYGCPESGPAMAENQLGLQFAWYTKEGIFHNTSKNEGETFSKRSAVSNNMSAKHPQIATLPNGNIVITWDESAKTDSGYVSKIGIQERNALGKTITTKYITAQKAAIAFPVLMPIDNHQILIAYTKIINEKSSVMYRMLKLK